MSRRVIGPFNRVEGDLEVKVDILDGRVESAWVVSPMYRGFEQMLRGKGPMDALVYVPRICGICSVAQSIAASTALAQMQGVSPPPNGELAANLILAAENVADHLTHFYLFFMPDFANQIYCREPWFAKTEARFKAVDGSATKELLPARGEFLNLMGLLAGRWPHTLALQPGGTSRGVELQEKMQILAILFSFRRFLEKTLFGDKLESVIELDSAAALRKWADRAEPSRADFHHFLRISDALDLSELGRAGDRFMSYGAYSVAGRKLFRSGLWNGGYKALDPAGIREDISSSWMQQQPEPKHPFEGVTAPSTDHPNAYTWCKAPRLNGQAMEVGALARQMINAHPLIRDLAEQSGGNVTNRVVARLLEIALVVVEMERWADSLQPREPFCSHADIPQEARGYGMVEAARGSLGHWVKIKNGRILNYQIIAPTTWNFSPRDAQGVPGALEQALVGAPLRDDEREPISVQHVVRSFDPCMVCTVH